MAWSFNTWASWADTQGRVWRIVVAAGALSGASGLYWYQRTQPKYPTAADEAVILAAVAERIMVQSYGDSPDVVALRVSTFASTNGAVAVTNAVGLYPSRPTMIRCAQLTGQYAKAPPFWIDMRPGVAWDGNFFGDFANGLGTWENMESNCVNVAWWTAHCGFEDEFAQWHLPFETNVPLYVTEVPYNQIAKPLSAMRATFRDATVVQVTNYTRTAEGVAGTFTNAWTAALANLYTAVVITNAGGVYRGEHVYSVTTTDSGDWTVRLVENVQDIVFGCLVNARTNDNYWAWLSIRPEKPSPSGEFYFPAGADGVVNAFWNGYPGDMQDAVDINGFAYKTYCMPASAFQDDIAIPPFNEEINRGWAFTRAAWSVRYNLQYLTNAATFWP